MSKSITSIRLNRFGGPEVLEAERSELGDPGEGEVLVDVEWIGLNRAEILWREGRYLVKPELPAPIGFECAGIVADVGTGVTRFSPGDRVSAVPARFDVRKTGTYASSIVVPEAALLPTPGSLEGPAAAAVWMAYLTAWGGLLDIGGLEEGAHVVIPAASSSVGLAAIQLCDLEGGVPIAVTTRADKVERLRELGAEHVVVSTSEDVVERVRELTEGRGAQLFFDPVAGTFLGKELACAAPGARIILYGLLDDKSATEIDVGLMLSRSIRIESYHIARTVLDQAVFEVAVGQITDGLSEGTLEPEIARVFPFSEIADAHRYMESGEHIGKVVVEVTD